MLGSIAALGTLCLRGTHVVFDSTNSLSPAASETDAGTGTDAGSDAGPG